MDSSIKSIHNFCLHAILQSLIFFSAYDHMFTICSGLSQIFGDEK